VFVNAAGYKIEGGCYAWTDNGWKEETTRTWLAPGFTQDDRHPVVCVSWHDANAYANWLTKVTGKTYRLMSEAEAEYISRAVTVAKQQPRYFFGNDQKDLCTYSNGADETAKAAAPGWVAAPCKDGFIYTAPAANYSPNPFGVYDTNGNVWSWTQDCYAESYSGAPTDGRPAAETQDCNRVLRGGSWIGRPEELGSAVRSKAFPGHHVNIDGFRVARSLNE
jgi:formylglycine-generating enzyme required for sulfatase activity